MFREPKLRKPSTGEEFRSRASRSVAYQGRARRETCWCSRSSGRRFVAVHSLPDRTPRDRPSRRRASAAAADCTTSPPRSSSSGRPSIRDPSRRPPAGLNLVSRGHAKMKWREMKWNLGDVLDARLKLCVKGMENYGYGMLHLTASNLTAGHFSCQSNVALRPPENYIGHLFMSSGSFMSIIHSGGTLAARFARCVPPIQLEPTKYWGNSMSAGELTTYWRGLQLSARGHS